MPSGAKTVPQNDDLAVALILDTEAHRQQITQETLAARVGISQSQVSRILSGTRPMTVGEMYKMCEALGLVASEVVARAERRPR